MNRLLLNFKHVVHITYTPSPPRIGPYCNDNLKDCFCFLQMMQMMSASPKKKTHQSTTLIMMMTEGSLALGRKL